MFKNFNPHVGNVVTPVHGNFSYDGPRDQWLLDRTRQWCGLYTKNDWFYRIDMASGIITFFFSDTRDADVFRRITRRSPTLITCR